jgi:hypothetical protein
VAFLTVIILLILYISYKKIRDFKFRTHLTLVQKEEEEEEEL